MQNFSIIKPISRRGEVFVCSSPFRSEPEKFNGTQEEVESPGQG